MADLEFSWRHVVHDSIKPIYFYDAALWVLFHYLGLGV